MMESQSIYHRQLQHKQQEIRLLTLLPGAKDDEIQCQLSIQRLRDELRYEALSYVWGTEKDKRKICVNSQPFWVTKNLYEALVRLRRHSSPRTLWIDAICIDQSKAAEKDHQLALMRQIYTMTECAVLWLGEEPETPEPVVSDAQFDQLQQALDTADAMLESTARLLRSLDSEGTDDFEDLMPNMTTPLTRDDIYITKTAEVDWTDPEIYYEQNWTLRNDPSLRGDSMFHAFCLFRSLAEGQCLSTIPYLALEPEGSQTYLTRSRQAAHWIMGRPWWERIWTVQECILPKRAVIHYGPVKAPFEMFLNAGMNLLRHRTSCCASVPGVNDMLNFVLDTIIELKRFHERQHQGMETGLGTLLRTFRSRDATDKRDKIYALLPLAHGSRATDSSTFIPTYRQETTPEEAFTKATLSMLKTDRTLDALLRPSHEQRNESLPSWVPDYANRVSFAGTGSHFSQQVNLYNACNNFPIDVKIFSNSILVLEGCIVGKIQEVSGGMFYQREASNTDVLKDWYKEANEHFQNGILSEMWRDQFWRTVCGDCVAIYRHDRTDWTLLEDEFRRMRDEDIVSWNAYCRSHAMEDLVVPALDVDTASAMTNSERIGSIAHTLRVNTSGRKFFVTDKGDMGIGPFYTGLHYPRREQVFVFPGGKTPLVLRSAGERDLAGVGKRMTYELMGDCYLHGYMDGQGMVEYKANKQAIYLI